MYDIETIKSMYDACRFEKALNINSHPAWCAVFTQEDLKVNGPIKLNS
jgi:hypothetical protein